MAPKSVEDAQEIFDGLARSATQIELSPGSIGGRLFRMTMPGAPAALVLLARDVAAYQSSLAGQCAQREVILTALALYTAFA